MIIKEMFYIPIKLKPELARASMTTRYLNYLTNLFFDKEGYFCNISNAIFIIVLCLPIIINQKNLPSVKGCVFMVSENWPISPDI
jgi:hypothetical protein